MATQVNSQTYKFIKEDSGKWYIDLPDWTGQKADLEMVEGADTMLDYVGDGEREVQLLLSEAPSDGAAELTLIDDYSEHVGGGMYLLQDYKGESLNKEMWLCSVTEFVFGKLPSHIYFKKV